MLRLKSMTFSGCDLITREIAKRIQPNEWRREEVFYVIRNCLMLMALALKSLPENLVRRFEDVSSRVIVLELGAWEAAVASGTARRRWVKQLGLLAWVPRILALGWMDLPR